MKRAKYPWTYWTLAEFAALLSPFASVERETFGFIGAFGQTERQRRLFAGIDSAVFDKLLPANKHYIAAAIAGKAG